MRELLCLAFFAIFSGCIAAPFEGPGFDDGAILEGPFMVAVTHTRVAKGQVPAFSDHLDAIKTQQDDHDGFVGRSLRIRLTSRTRWTITIWEDEDSMFRFVTEGAHLEAMLDSSTVIDGVRSAVWTVEDDDAFPPSWNEALTELDLQSPEIPWED